MNNAPKGVYLFLLHPDVEPIAFYLFCYLTFIELVFLLGIPGI